MSHHTYESLRTLKGQAIKDIWHAKIGKPAGLRNVTGLKSMEEIIQAILKAESEEGFVKSFRMRPPKQGLQEAVAVEKMPPKGKPGRKPKPKNIAEPQRPQSQIVASVPSQAYETTEIPLKVEEVIRVVVRKLIVEGTEYFLESKTNKVYSSVNGRPGHEYGMWNPETHEIVEN